MCTWVVIGVVVLLVLIAGARRARKIPGRVGIETITGMLGKRYLGENWSDSFTPTTPEQIQGADHLMAYADRILERQIGKAQGLLPFNAILLGVLGFERSRMPDTLRLPSAATDFLTARLGSLSHSLPWLGTCEISLFCLLVLTMVGLAVSSLLCLSLFSARWHPVPEYASFHNDIGASLKLVRARSRAMEWATVIAKACLIVSVFLVATAELGGGKSGRGGPQINAGAEITVPGRG